MSNGQDAKDYSMLELFCMEVETQAAFLFEGISNFAQQAPSPQILEELSRAARTIKGTARLMEIEAAINLSSGLETILNSLQNQSIPPSKQQIEALNQGLQWLVDLSRVEEDNLNNWLTSHQGEITAICEGMAAGHAAASVVTPSTSLPISPAPVAIPESKIEKIVETIQVETQTVVSIPAPISAPITESIPAPIPAPIATIGNMDSLTDTSMLELFRLEVETQANVLNSGLLALESQPESPQALESLMRSAHSIKGAARIVAIDAAVNLAHIMEDCFVAAQNHKIILGNNDIDILLHGVDLLLGIGQATSGDLKSWLMQQIADIEATRQELAGILNPSAKPAPKTIPAQQTVISNPPENVAIAPNISPLPLAEISPATTTAITPTVPLPQVAIDKPAIPTPSATKLTNKPVQDSNISAAAATASNKDRVVRVSAENLNRIMGLAGESLIEANWLQPFADSLTGLKKRQLELSKILENFQDALTTNPHTAGEKFIEVVRQKERECREILGDRLTELELFARRTGNLSDRLYREVIASHMRPFDDGVQSFPRMVRDVARRLGKQAKLEILGKATPVDRDILTKLEAPLTHILRNGVDHGIEMPDDRIAAGKPAEGTIRLEAIHRGGMLSITIADDGSGIDLNKLRQKIVNKNLTTQEMAAQMNEAELMEFLFLPGFSTAKQVTEISGRGVGLDIAKSMAHEVGGTVRASSQLGKGTTFHFQLPLTLSVVRTLLVEISGESYAFPLARIEQIVMVEKVNIYSMENRQYFTMDDKNIGLVSAAQVLELQEYESEEETLSVVVIGEQSDYYGLVVDRFLGEHDLVVRPLDIRLGKVQDISAAALMGDGSPILIVDVSDLIRSVNNLLHSSPLNRFQKESAVAIKDKTKRVLIVDDSITVREMERKILQNRGYRVDVAVDGMDGWHCVCSNYYDLIISDVDMPRLNGIELVTKIKNDPKFSMIPVIIISYKDREEDRIKGLEAGANYYLTKSSFHDDSFVNAVRDLIGT